MLSGDKMKTFLEYADDVISFYEENGIDLGEKKPKISLDDSPVFRLDVFAPTGHYDFTKDEITLRINNRHAKDIMRTLCHELIHAWQYRRDPEGYMKFNKAGNLKDNAELLGYEREAYEKSNVLFRMWTEARGPAV